MDSFSDSNQNYFVHHQKSHTTYRSRRRWIHSPAVASILVVLLATLIPLSLAASTCSKHEYWDSNDCVACTKCGHREIVVRPCQPHMDTLCKPLNSIEIDWNRSLATEKTHPRHHHVHHQTIQAQASTLTEDELVWDWQMVSLVLAVAACLLFFIGTAVIAINYIRQWRKIKKQFDNGKLASLSKMF